MQLKDRVHLKIFTKLFDTKLHKRLIFGIFALET